MTEPISSQPRKVLLLTLMDGFAQAVAGVNPVGEAARLHSILGAHEAEVFATQDTHGVLVSLPEARDEKALEADLRSAHWGLSPKIVAIELIAR